MPKEYFIDETEWWDRLAAAVDRLAAGKAVVRRRVRAEGRLVDWIGGAAPSAPEADPRDPGRAVAAYVFDEVRDVETLRRITQMPDETPLDLLMLPTAVYCAEMNSFVSVNNPAVSLAEHLSKLERGQS